MYVCGVTVYDDAHIGHARCYVAFDAIYRHLLARGYCVVYVRNFTDVDDKIIYRASQLGVRWDELALRYINSFKANMIALGVLSPSVEPRVTTHIPEIIALIQDLIVRGYVYIVDNGDIFFAVRKFLAYGCLSGRDLKDMIAGARVKVDIRKHDPMDFALWKSSKPDEPAWISPWGLGRPGWHIECSAMSKKYLGVSFDIHGGGKDLLFPHHENEMAQSEALTGKQFVRYWMHNGFVRINYEKMSKSFGNFFTITDILKTTRPDVLRLFLLSKHYRSPLDFSKQALQKTTTSLNRLYTALLSADQVPFSVVTPDSVLVQKVKRIIIDFELSMDDDFNTAAAIGALFDLARITNRLAREEINSASRNAGLNFCAVKLRELGGRLGLLNRDPQQFLQGQIDKMKINVNQGIDPAWIEELITSRQAARKTKDFAKADSIRDELAALGIILRDGVKRTTWYIKD